MSRLKMGIIGAGGIAQQRHIPAYLSMPDKVELVAVHDVNQEQALEMVETFGIPFVFDHYENLLAEVDAVTICTPNKFHADLAIKALENGVHVLCEKPMAITAAECAAMIDASRKANKLLSVAYHYRFMEAAAVAKEASWDIGEPLVTRVQALRRRKVPGWGVFTNKELQGGGSLIDYGCHLLDLALWLLGSPVPVEVSGSSYNRLSRSPDQVNDWGTFDYETFEVDDHVSAFIKFEGGGSMLFECSWAANIKEDTKTLSISGTDGGLSVYPFELYRQHHGKMMTSTAGVDDSEENAGIAQAHNFINSCLGEASLRVKPEEAMQVTETIEAIYRSDESGTSVSLRSDS